MKFILLFLAIATATAIAEPEDADDPAPTAVGVIGNIFESCLKDGSFTCVKPKLLKFLRASLKNDRILITDDMIIQNNRKFSPDFGKIDAKVIGLDELSKRERLRYMMLEKIDNFLSSHELNIKLPKELVTGEVFPFAPKHLFDYVPKEINIPLSEVKDVNEERGFTKKVMIPFLLGLKLKATTFIPLAVALIALKTWKALTLGLLSMVLSAAMVIFKFAKPKVINYEVYHYPNHHAAPIPVEHSYLDHGYGRSEGGQDLAYSAHLK